jgi:hypothetical protein
MPMAGAGTGRGHRYGVGIISRNVITPYYPLNDASDNPCDFLFEYQCFMSMVVPQK